MLLEDRRPQVSPLQPPREAVASVAQPPLPGARADGLLYECPLRCAAAIRTCNFLDSGIVLLQHSMRSSATGWQWLGFSQLYVGLGDEQIMMHTKVDPSPACLTACLDRHKEQWEAGSLDYAILRRQDGRLT